MTVFFETATGYFESATEATVDQPAAVVPDDSAPGTTS
jgi:hypothetical protein